MDDEELYREAARYSMVVEWDPEDRLYIVTVPELRGCVMHGGTREEAVRQGLDAIASWLDAARAWGMTIPAPREYAVAV